MIKVILLSIILNCFALFLFAADEHLELELAKKILLNTEQINTTSGKKGQKILDENILAFNFIYRSDKASVIYKEVFKESIQTAAKVYALIGLYLKKDKEFENLKNEFLKENHESIGFSSGCCGGLEVDPNYFINEMVKKKFDDFKLDYVIGNLK